jgi:hypothetical protein
MRYDWLVAKFTAKPELSKKRRSFKSTMLRWTNRLRDRLAAHGVDLMYWQGDTDKEMHYLREAELVANPAGVTEGASQPPLDFLSLARMMYDASERPWKRDKPPELVFRWSADRDESKRFRRTAFPTEASIDQCIDILWLSDTEFVSSLRYSGVEGMYSMEVFLREPESYLELFAYSLDQFIWKTDGWPFPTSIRHAGFLMKLLRPILQKLSKLQVTLLNCVEILPISSVLSLVPTTSDYVHEVIDIVFTAPGKDLVEAMSMFPFHAKVRLSLRDPTQWNGQRIEAQVLNGNLRAYRYLRHPASPAAVSKHHWIIFCQLSI